MAGAGQGLKHSQSESSLEGPEGRVRGGVGYSNPHSLHQRKLCSAKIAGCSLSLPRSSRKVGGYHLVQRNSAFVSEITTSAPLSASIGATPSRSPLQHSSSLPTRWYSPEGGASRGNYSSDHNSSTESSPPGMGVYRDVDLLDERSRQRRTARVRFDRSRRLRQPYSIPLRMCQSMCEDRTSSLADFLTDSAGVGLGLGSMGGGGQLNPLKVLAGSGSGSGSKSSSNSPVKPEGVGGGTLVRSRSIDNLELSRLRLSDSLDSRSQVRERSASQQAIDLDQVSADLRNMHMV